jgi:two-component system nitrate/nitrite response regulator NarL
MDILIVDDHQIFSLGLKELLLSEKPNLHIEQCANFKGACSHINSSSPTLILLDVDLGGENGIELIKDLHSLRSNLKIAILSGSESVTDMKASIENGAIGYITKSLDPDTLLKVVSLLYSTGSYFPSDLLPYLVENNNRSSKSDLNLDIFTSRQLEVVTHLKKGISNKLIAYTLGISEGTVKIHISAILEKLSVTNRSAAIIKLT